MPALWADFGQTCYDLTRPGSRGCRPTPCASWADLGGLGSDLSRRAKGRLGRLGADLSRLDTTGLKSLEARPVRRDTGKTDFPQIAPETRRNGIRVGWGSEDQGSALIWTAKAGHRPVLDLAYPNPTLTIPQGMARDLSPHVAKHDDPTSAQHEIDKAQKKLRNETHYEASPAIEIKAGGGILDGVFKSPVAGFCFRMKAGSAEKAKDPAAYTREVTRASRERVRFKRIRERGGRKRTDYDRYKHGAVSLVTTVAPWAVPSLARIGRGELENLMLHLAEVVAAEVEEASGRPTFGGGVHLDTEVPHLHSHILKVSEDGWAYPKARFLTAGPWTVGAARIAEKFPGLLSENKEALLKANLARKRVENLIDLRCARRIDRELETWIRDRGLWAKYLKDCEDYRRKKARVQKEEGQRKLMQAALSYFSRERVWPLAAHLMKVSMMRMIPKEIRPAVIMAIRAKQIIRRPVTALATQGVQQLMPARKQPEHRYPHYPKIV